MSVYAIAPTQSVAVLIEAPSYADALQLAIDRGLVQPEHILHARAFTLASGEGARDTKTGRRRLVTFAPFDPSDVTGTVDNFYLDRVVGSDDEHVPGVPF